MTKNITRSSILAMLVAGVISLGVVFPLKTVYAHTFSGDESAAFLALVKILQADSHLVQSNIASNPTLAQAHANAVANDLTKAISDLNQTVQSKPTPTADVVKGKINNIDALLQEAITVCIEKNQLTNSTVKGQAVSDIIDETLERHRQAYGIEEGKSTAGHNSIVNMADYQSAQAIAAKAQEMFGEAKQLVHANGSPSTLAPLTNDEKQVVTLVL